MISGGLDVMGYLPLTDTLHLIGTDVITLGDMCISDKDDQTCFSFRLPSKEHIELTE